MNTGDFLVTKLAGDKLDGVTDFEFKDDCLTFLHGGEYVVSMKQDTTIPTKHRIAVGEDFKGSITIDGLLITADQSNPPEQWAEKPAIKVDGSAQLTLCLKGENVLKGGKDAAAIQFQDVQDGGYLTITGDGSLEARGGDEYLGASSILAGGAGIGGQYDKATRNIAIEGGTITAIGSDESAGIGGGAGAGAENIKITGGTVTAIGKNGAGIGGGKFGEGKDIVITGGVVTAAGEVGAGIGSGYKADSYSTIEILGGRVVAKSGTGDAIGGGRENDLSNKTKITIGNASIYASSDDTTGKPFSAAPKNEAGKDVYLLLVNDFNSFETITVDGKTCKNRIPVPEKQELYLYLTEGQKVSYDGRHYLTKLVDSRLELIPDQNSSDFQQDTHKPAPETPDNDHKPNQGSSSSGNSGSGGSNSTSRPQITHKPDGTMIETIQKSDGTTVETTKRPDGSKTIVETQRDKTVTKTDWDKQGNIMETVKKPDGSSTTTELRKDGTKVVTRADQKGNVSAEVEVPAKNKKVTVMIPTPKQPASGDVIVIVNPDGTEKVVSKTVPSVNGLIFSTQKNVTIKVEDRSKTFDDVSNGHWAESAVDFVTSRSLFNGVNEKIFAPDPGMTRGMLAVVLHNLESNPAADSSISFTDVAENAWYKGAVQWAVQKGIVSGYGNGKFGANDQITREQLAVMLYQYSGSPSVSSQPLDFMDADQVSDYADRAMHWAVDKKILNGNGNGFLDPKGTATRAQVAVMLTRLVESNVQNDR